MSTVERAIELADAIAADLARLQQMLRQLPTPDDGSASSVAAIRFRLGLTQTELAERARVDLATVWRWENEGVPTRGVARAYLEGLAREAGFPGISPLAFRPKGERA